jgi:putative aldouronate transport system permease protein
MIGMSRGERIFQFFNSGFMILLIILMIYPFWYILMASVSDYKLASGGGFFLKPAGFSLDSYKAVFQNVSILSGFKVAIVTTLAGVILGTFFSATTAYAISKKRLRGGMLFTFMILFTMLFNGGLVPAYMLVKQLGMIDTYWALILPNLIQAWNIFVMLSFFRGMSEEMEDAAKIDGANDLTVFFNIVLPLSKAVIATIGLFIAVMYWNDYFSTVLYIYDKHMWQLQMVLRDLITNTSMALKNSNAQIGFRANISEFTVRMASIIVATVPILIVYPFLQRHFVKGVMVGSMKG